MKTTLNKIRAHSPCSDGWSKLLGNLGKTKADDEQLAVTTILESNGLDDALWCLRAVDGHHREMRLFAVDCARSVQHLMTASRSISALDVAELYANGFATAQELAAARVAAWTASRAAASAAASAAVRGTAWTAAWTASSAASRDAASAAVRDAARDTGAWGAAWDAAWAASRAVQATLLCIVCAEIEQREQA